MQKRNETCEHCGSAIKPAPVIVHLDTRQISDHYPPAIENDDWSGLEADDAEKLQGWLDWAYNTYGGGLTFNYVSESGQWGRCDVSRLDSDVLTVEIWGKSA